MAALFTIMEMQVLELECTRGSVFEYLGPDVQDLFGKNQHSFNKVVTRLIDQGLVEEVVEMDSSRPGKNPSGLVIAELGRNKLIRNSIVKYNTGEILISDQGNNATCVVHSMAKVIIKSLYWHANFHEIEWWRIEFMEIISSMIQVMNMDQIRGGGMSPLQMNMKELKLTVGEDSETIGLQLQVKEVSIHDQEDETGLDRKWIIGVQVGELGYHAMAVHTIDREDATITCVNSWGMEAPVVVLSMKRPDLVMWRLTVLVIAE